MKTAFRAVVLQSIY